MIRKISLKIKRILIIVFLYKDIRIPEVNTMRILIDADGCPVTEIAEETAFRENIPCLIFCDTSHIFKSPYAQIIICEKGLDSVDFTILNRCRKNDIVITQDYGLASMCLVKKSFPINQNGLRYTNENIDSMLITCQVSKLDIFKNFREEQPLNI